MYGDGEATVPLRAEVGLLTRNIKIRGNNDPQWNEVIEACPEGFNTGILLNVNVNVILRFKVVFGQL